MMVLTALGTFTGVTLQSSVVMAESLQIESRKVIGEDDRFRISDTSKQPYSSIAYLQIYTSTSNYSRGTAFVVGKDTLVTAGHVIKMCLQNCLQNLSWLQGKIMIKSRLADSRLKK
ncbi:hypothetical protein [Enterococcus rivorum]|uniref:hypothetical protein n=1 Tax=Enterococcus rivorum TaxID=762845 RepID=UPI003632F019